MRLKAAAPKPICCTCCVAVDVAEAEGKLASFSKASVYFFGLEGWRVIRDTNRSGIFQALLAAHQSNTNV